MMRGAVISPNERYRFHLWREVPLPLIGHPPLERFAGRGRVLFVMNNPSKADALEDDPTIRRVMGFASSWGFSRVYVANTNPHRSTDPRRALMPPAAVLDVNDEWLRRLARECELVVAAWGAASEPVLASRALDTLRYEGPVHALALTKHGHPKHPLYLRRDLRPVPWKARIIVEIA